MSKKKLLMALLLSSALSLQNVMADTSGRLDVKSGDTGTVESDMHDLTNGNGGAVYNAGTVNVNDGVIFENNTANDGGGSAIFNTPGGTINIGDNVTFRNNTALKDNPDADGISKGDQMGTIYSEGRNNQETILNIGNNVTFEENKAGSGGAIYLYGKTQATIGANAKFINNSTQKTLNDTTPSSGGGAINITANGEDNVPNITIGENSLFEGNIASYGGAISVTTPKNGSGGKAALTIKNGAIFRNNKAIGNIGGAIYNAGTTEIGTALFEGNSGLAGGAIFNDGDFNPINGVTFNSNEANLDGGAIYTRSQSSEMSISGTTFNDNIAGRDGGAIASIVDLELKSNVFVNNHAEGRGGALFLDETGSKDKTFTGNNFDSNSANNAGGAVYLKNTGNKTFEGGSFTNNSTDGWGGAIAASCPSGSSEMNTTVSGVYFENNYASQGGAIGTGRAGDTSTANNLIVQNGTTFVNNTAAWEGGAIWAGGDATITDALFDSNKTTDSEFNADNPNYKTDSEGGGAIFVGSNSKTSITGSTFTNNSSASVGGAIATRSNATTATSSLTVENSIFDGNSAQANGGAIASYVGATVTDTSFTNNSAGAKGGAIWSNGDLTVEAKNADVLFAGNTANDGADIYMDSLVVAGGAESTGVGSLTLNAADGYNLTLADGISGAETFDVTVNSDSNTGTVAMGGTLSNANITVEAGIFKDLGAEFTNGSTITMASADATFDAMNGKLTSYADILKAENGMTITTDISTATGETDVFGKNIKGAVTIAAYNPIGDSLYSSGYLDNEGLKEMLGLGSDATLTIVDTDTHTVLTPLRWINTTSDGKGIGFAPTGNSYKDFNPAVMASPVAAQLGGYLTQLNSYNEAFANMDMYMLMTKSQRQALKLRNKYAAAYNNIAFDPTGTPYDDKGVWARPYATFENVSLKGGPKTSNVSWGSFFGAESELYELENGWDAMYGIYAGYNGSHQAYDGIGIYQNGATLGLVGMAYKGNLFTGLTVNVGTNVGEASTLYGDDNFNMLMAGIASKTGYNFEFAEGKFIIQPSLLVSYSFVNTFDYTNAAGIRINSDPLNAIQVEPGIKFIGNLQNGWQPYAGVSFVGNIMDKTSFHANDASLPDLSVKPFVRYGLGIRKTWGERLTGFFQTFLNNGGRNGIGFQAGIRWTLGK